MLRRGARLGFLVLGLGTGLAAGCLLELERGLSCGDGWVDTESGEACDPKDDRPGIVYECEGPLDGRCDPETCQIVCPPRCGDGIVNGQEECDYMATCDSDLDCPEEHTCYEHECLRLEGAFVLDRSCHKFANTAIGEVSKKKQYSSGEVGRCTKACIFDRKQCSFCGDGEVDAAYEDLSWTSEEPVAQPAEECDAQDYDHALLRATNCVSGCMGAFENLPSGMVLDCEPRTCEACEFVFGGIGGGVAHTVDEVQCCLTPGSPCPEPGLGLQCCGQADNPQFLCNGTCPNTP